jgi:sugar lactone lactonase YvrE
MEGTLATVTDPLLRAATEPIIRGATRRPPIRPQRWQPPPAPPRAKQTEGSHPLPPVLRLELPGTGPEDVLLDAKGRIYTGVDDGRILRVTPDGNHIDVITSTGGRPLGLEWLGEDRLLVCDAYRGLLRVDTVLGDVHVIEDKVNGVRMRFCDNAAVASDGTIYFSDASQRFGLHDSYAEAYEHSCTGRLLRLSPGGQPEVLLDGLKLANGVALARDESYVVIAETSGYRLTRLWLTGPRAGRTELLISNLPGMPDNLSTDANGLIWIALLTPRNPILDGLLPKPAFLRQAAWAIPPRLQPKPQKTLWVMAVDEDGAVRYDIQGPGEIFHTVTGVRVADRRVYLGSLEERAIAVFDLPD